MSLLVYIVPVQSAPRTKYSGLMDKNKRFQGISRLFIDILNKTTCLIDMEVKNEVSEGGEEDLLGERYFNIANTHTHLQTDRQTDRRFRLGPFLSCLEKKCLVDIIFHYTALQDL